MSVNESEVCDLFDEIENHFKIFDEINTNLAKEFIEEMEKFDGSEKYVSEMKKAFQRIENNDEECEEEESSAATDEWRFKIAINIFKKFKIRFEIKRKVTTDPPVQQGHSQQDIPEASEQKRTQEAAKRIEKQHANCGK